MAANGEGLTVVAAVQAAASMAAASPLSSVASAADLASISSMEIEPENNPVEATPGQIPTALVAAAILDGPPAERIAAVPVEAIDS